MTNKKKSPKRVVKIKAWAALDTPTHTKIVAFDENSSYGSLRVFPNKRLARYQNNEAGGVVPCEIHYELPKKK